MTNSISQIALSARPALAANDVFHAAEALDRAGQFDRALLFYEHALALEPNNFRFHVHRGYALLRLGRLQEGWSEFGWYWHPSGLAACSPWGLTAPRPLLQKDADLQGQTILVTGWGGLGDIIMFSQLAQQLTMRGAAKVTLHITHNIEFFRSNRFGYEVVSHTAVDDFFAMLTQHDAWVPNAYLPVVLGTEIALAPNKGAFFSADPVRRSHWREHIATNSQTKAHRLKVGIAWCGDPGNLYEKSRSIRASDLRPLLETEGVDWYVVQKNERNHQLSAMKVPRVTDASASFANLEDTAALMCELDLVISIDSLPAHLAASLGRPVWLLLSAAADWRWGIQGEETHWYESMRLYRQKELGDWPELLSRVAADLALRRGLCPSTTPDH